MESSSNKENHTISGTPFIEEYTLSATPITWETSTGGIDIGNLGNPVFSYLT